MNSSESDFQQQFFAYISTFDGTKKDFWGSEIQDKFNCVMHQSYNDIDALKLIHANLFALGSKAVSFNLQRMSADVFLAKFRLVNPKTDITIEQLINTQGGRIVETSPGVDDAYLLHADDRDELLTTTTRVCQSQSQADDMCRPNILTYKHTSEGQVKSSKIRQFGFYRHDWSSLSTFG